MIFSNFKSPIYTIKIEFLGKIFYSHTWDDPFYPLTIKPQFMWNLDLVENDSQATISIITKKHNSNSECLDFFSQSTTSAVTAAAVKLPQIFIRNYQLLSCLCQYFLFESKTWMYRHRNKKQIPFSIHYKIINLIRLLSW